MKQIKMLAVAAAVVFAPTLAMALNPPQSSALRSRPAGSVIDVILDRDSRADDSEWRDETGRQDKQAKKAAKDARKQQKKREKEFRKAAHEREKDLREATREREKDRREAAREHAKNARDRGRNQ